MALKPCLVCGRATTGSRCPEHALRKGSTRAWRKVRAEVLARDGHRCQFCGQPATEVDHIVPHAHGGPDHPANARALCHACHAARAEHG